MINSSKLLVKALVFASIAAMFTFPAAAQPTYAVPRKIEIKRNVRQAFPGYFGQQFHYPQLIPESIYPIGWSRGGNFAYYVEPVDEACGCYFANLKIQDMRTDEVLWEFKYRQDESMGANGEMEDIDTIAKLWKRNRALFAEKLREHGIIASRSTLLDRTFTVRGRKYSAGVQMKKAENPDGMGPRVNKLSIILASPSLGSKVLFSSDHSKDEFWFVLDAGVIGALKSPFENRAAVVAIEIKRGWEGPPHTADIRITGADLLRGFVRK